MAELTEDQKTIETLKKQLETIAKERDTYKGQVEQSEGIIEDLKSQLEEKVAGTIEIPTLQVGKETYEFLDEFFYKNQEVTLDLLKENKKLAEELVKEGVSALRLVKAK